MTTYNVTVIVRERRIFRGIEAENAEDAMREVEEGDDLDWSASYTDEILGMDAVQAEEAA